MVRRALLNEEKRYERDRRFREPRWQEKKKSKVERGCQEQISKNWFVSSTSSFISAHLQSESQFRGSSEDDSCRLFERR